MSIYFYINEWIIRLAHMALSLNNHCLFIETLCRRYRAIEQWKFGVHYLRGSWPVSRRSAVWGAVRENVFEYPREPSHVGTWDNFGSAPLQWVPGSWGRSRRSVRSTCGRSRVTLPRKGMNSRRWLTLFGERTLAVVISETPRIQAFTSSRVVTLISLDYWRQFSLSLWKWFNASRSTWERKRENGFLSSSKINQKFDTAILSLCEL